MHIILVVLLVLLAIAWLCGMVWAWRYTATAGGDGEPVQKRWWRLALVVAWPVTWCIVKYVVIQ